MARSAARRASGASVWNGTIDPPAFFGSGGTTTASPLASTAAPGVASGSPARRCACLARASSPAAVDFPCRRFCASPAVSQRPSLVMPMGTTSYLFLSMALRTDAAESSETSCSPLRPPNRIPTRVFFIAFHHKTRSTTTHIYEFGGGLCPFCLGPLFLLGEGAVEGELFLHQAGEICRVL